MATPSPEAMITEQLHVGLVPLILEARARAKAGSPEQAGTWQEVCAWLEGKLPPGTVVLGDGPVQRRPRGEYDPQLSPEANARMGNEPSRLAPRATRGTTSAG